MKGNEGTRKNYWEKGKRGREQDTGAMKGWIAGKESEEKNVQREVNRKHGSRVSVFVLVSVLTRGCF